VSAPTASEAKHYRVVAQRILSGDVVPVLGAGANLCDREPGTEWQPDARPRTELPSGVELANWLARQFSAEVDKPVDLLRVSQAAALSGGYGPFFRELHHVFASSENAYEPTSLHRFLAGLPAVSRRRGLPARPQLILTTNYDDLLERAFADAQEPIDIVYYLAQGEGDPRRDIGRVVHVTPDGERRVVRKPKSYLKLSPETRPVVVKLHGTVREDADEDSWVITEDHYIEYLTQANLSEFVPVKLLGKLKASNFLFLGYAMKDWNMRVMLHRIWAERDSSWKSWAVQLEANELDTEFWAAKDVDIHSASLRTYLAEVQACLETVPAG